MKKRILSALAAVLVLALIPLVAYAASGGSSSSGTIEFATGGLQFGGGDSGAVGVPTFDFGTDIQISGNTETYANSQTDDSLKYIKVADLTGSNSGWNVRVSASNFSGGSGNTLAGATLLIKIPVANITQRTAVAPGASIIPNTTSTPTSGYPTADLSLPCTGGAAQRILFAAAAKGQGIWWAEPVVSLRVPGGQATIGSHACTLTWQLITGPN